MTTKKKKKKQDSSDTMGWKGVRLSAVRFHALSGMTAASRSVAEEKDLSDARTSLLETGLASCYNRFIKPVEEAFSDAMFDPDERWHGQINNCGVARVDYFGRARKLATELELTELPRSCDDPAVLMELVTEADAAADRLMGMLTELKPMEEMLQNMASVAEKQTRALLPIAAETVSQSLALFSLSADSYKILAALRQAVEAIEIAVKRVTSRKQVLGNMISLLPGVDPSWRFRDALTRDNSPDEAVRPKKRKMPDSAKRVYKTNGL